MAPRVAAIVALALLAAGTRLLFMFAYRSTDFEVHRNWLAITHSVPLSRWYYEETSLWTLDYPPLFAYFEWLLSQPAALVDPEMLRVENLEYASTGTIAFQRVSVIVGDLVLLLGTLRGAEVCAAGTSADSSPGLAAVALVLFNPGLLLVDHIHFQYNGMLLGLLLLSAADIQQGNTYRGAFLFSALLNMKQIFLYTAPVYFVYLLRSHCGLGFAGGRLSFRWSAFLLLGATVAATFAVLWAPIVMTGQLMQAARRLFPFGRGLTHAYWAPNVWAFYNTADRALAKAGLGGQQGHSATAGMAEVYESSVLWTVPPKATFVLTVLVYLPLLAAIWRQAPLPEQQAGGESAARTRRRSGAFFLYVAMGSAVAFAVGWHVHEKAILMVTIPLLVVAISSRSREFIAAVAALSFVATFSLLPLMPKRSLETRLKWLLFLAGHILELRSLARQHQSLSDAAAPCESLKLLGFGPFPGWLLVLGLALLGFYCDFGGHELIFGPSRMEFLPLMLTSNVCALLVLWSFLRLARLVLSAEGSEKAD